MVKRGEMSEEEFREWLEETPNIKRLPERVRKKKRTQKKKRVR